MPPWAMSFWTDPTLRVVALGVGILGAVAGSLGCFAILRKQSLMGDAISHAALPGVMLVYMLTRAKMPLPLVLGAALFGWLATLIVLAITRTTRIAADTALCGVMSVFFGLGILLQTHIQRMGSASQAGLDRFIFGQAATLLDRDIYLMAGLGGTALVVMALFWKEFKLLTFDPAFAGTLGFPTRGLDILLTALLVIAIVIGLQCVGVVLMSALVVAPGAAARQWTNRLSRMTTLAAGFGAASGIIGALISDRWRLPTGPAVVLVATALVVVSLLAAPERGLLWRVRSGVAGRA